MPFIRRAVIDVGTNSVKLLVADVSDRDVRPVWEESKQTRLGRGFYETRELQPEPITKTARAVARFAETARAQKAVSIRIIATSAARDALNASELVAALEKSSGLAVEIISGAQEANWAFEGVTTDLELAREPLLILDVGGGSTEFILGRGQQQLFQESFPMGTVRLLEKFPQSDPPKREELSACREWLRNFLSETVLPKLQPVILAQFSKEQAEGAIRLVGTGGTTSILARMEAGMGDFNRAQIEATLLTRERIHAQVERLWRLPLAERREIVGLPPKRADVILTGALIFETVMERFGFARLRVSTRGLRFAAVMSGKSEVLKSEIRETKSEAVD
jgi:exopolyphosphatase/guanosine-5'-triphosphate,3'-diphosphate pyrophosphatase